MNRRERRAKAACRRASSSASRASASRVMVTSAHWRDGQSDGIRLTLHHDGDEGTQLARRLLNDLPVWDLNANAEDVLNRLGDIGAREQRDAGSVYTAFMSIFWLTTRGHLAPDEWNGLVWACAYEDMLVFTEQNPLTIDIARGAQTGVDVTAEARSGGINAIRTIADWARARPPR